MFLGFFRLDGIMLVRSRHPATVSSARLTSTFPNLIKLLGVHGTSIIMSIRVDTDLKHIGGRHNAQGFGRLRGFYARASKKLFAFLWRRRFVLLGVTSMIKSEHRVVFRSRNFDLQNGTRILSLEKWVQCL
jgi:hypothetical protein